MPVVQYAVSMVVANRWEEFRLAVARQVFVVRRRRRRGEPIHRGATIGGVGASGQGQGGLSRGTWWEAGRRMS